MKVHAQIVGLHVTWQHVVQHRFL